MGVLRAYNAAKSWVYAYSRQCSLIFSRSYEGTNTKVDKTFQKFPAGGLGGEVCIIAGNGSVEISVAGPRGRHRPSDWMTPEQAITVGVGLIQAAQVAHKKGDKQSGLDKTLLER